MKINKCVVLQYINIGFITSNLIGKRDDGTMIKEFEASHGTVADLWHMHLNGEETSMNPLGMAEAIISAMEHSVLVVDSAVSNQYASSEEMKHYTQLLRKALHNTFRAGEGTRDMSGPTGLTTEQFIEKVKERLILYLKDPSKANNFKLTASDDVESDKSHLVKVAPDPRKEVDKKAIAELFSEYDVNGDGVINMEEFEHMLLSLGIAPLTKPNKTHPETEVDV